MKELKGKRPSELQRTLAEKREALRVFRFEMSGSKIKNVKTGRNLRADIARVLTLMRSEKGK